MIIRYLVLLLFIVNCPSAGIAAPMTESDLEKVTNAVSETVNPKALKKAMEYYRDHQAMFANADVVTLIDFTLPSDAKRMHLIQMRDPSRPQVFHYRTAHGQNSGGVFAKRFSNRDDSHQSSLGAYLTLKPYKGKHGLSLQLEGLEKGVNDMAKSRSIVVHGAAYLSDTWLRRVGMIGRSHGCPAVAYEYVDEIIDAIKGGSLLYIYGESDHE